MKMSAGRTPRDRNKVKSTSKSDDDSRSGIAREVLDELFELFKELGVATEKSRPRTSKRRIDRALFSSTNKAISAARVGEILTTWYQDAQYLDDLGNPIPLTRRGARRSFESLARSVAPAHDSDQILAQLKNLGAVKSDDEGLLRVRMRSLPVYEERQLAAQYTLASLHSFLRMLRHNLGADSANSEQLFHRVAFSRDLDAREIPALKVRLKRQGQQFLESFDNWMAMRSSSRSTQRSKTRKHAAKAAVGIYLAIEDE